MNDNLQSESEIKEYLRSMHSWNLTGQWTLPQLELVQQTSAEIKSYMDGITEGKGIQWMRRYLGRTMIRMSGRSRGLGLPGIIFLPGDWEHRSNPNQYLAHELAHIWDIKAGLVTPWGTVNGPADKLNSFINTAEQGAIPISGFACRYCDNSGVKHIPFSFRWKFPKTYGNNSTADYLADAFGWMIYGPNYIPKIEVKQQVEEYISEQAKSLL